jgi:hypothetical protein
LELRPGAAGAEARHCSKFGGCALAFVRGNGGVSKHAIQVKS